MICGFGFGGFFFGIISKHLCNPTDVRPVLQPTSNGNEILFLEEVAARVPTMIRSLNLCWIALWAFGLCTITRYHDPLEQSTIDEKINLEGNKQSTAEAEAEAKAE